MQYITNLMTQLDNAKGPISQDGWNFIPVDLNSGVGGAYIYTGYQLGGAGDAITAINYIAYDTQQDNPPVGWQWDGVDLNSGAGGKYIYMVWQTGGATPITSLMYQVTHNNEPPYEANYTPVGCDLNEGAGGPYIWGYYSTTVAAVPMSQKVKNKTVK